MRVVSSSRNKCPYKKGGGEKRKRERERTFEARKWDLTKHLICQDLNLEFSSLQKCEK